MSHSWLLGQRLWWLLWRNNKLPNIRAGNCLLHQSDLELCYLRAEKGTLFVQPVALSSEVKRDKYDKEQNTDEVKLLRTSPC